ncbi:MAG: HEAT repeat domain-containing protein [Gammaproteobacteria bacterium]
MLPIIFIVVATFAFLLLIGEQKPKNHREKVVVKLILYTFLTLSIVFLLTETLIPPSIQFGAGVFIVCFLVFKTLMANFWGKVFYQSALIILLFWCGYLYSISQIPYGDKPFDILSDNQPKPLEIDKLKTRVLLGLPSIETPPTTTHAGTSSPNIPTPAKTDKSALTWASLWPLMETDARIRQIMQDLREKQQQDLTAYNNQLNATSVTSTSMRRHALSRDNIEDLLKENAISKARYRTLLETWNLLDSDEHAFNERQVEERFHTLLALMEDPEIDESHKVDLINFIVDHFAADIRLFKPLISVYDGLDEEYPRLKRLNKAYLDLYLAKREAILNGLHNMGRPALQPLLDYRKKVLPTVSYSQARLDDFIAHNFGVNVRTLYKLAPSQSVPDFLNRKKYAALEKFSGPSFEQDYVRKSLLKLVHENAPPKAGEPLLGLSDARYQSLVTTLNQPYSAGVDHLLIDPDPAIRANVAWRLAELKNPYTMPLILELMRDQNPEVRRLAAIAVGNFVIQDTQGSSDPKFTEIVRMLQNYRSNSDAFGRAWAVTALANVGDQQKALYAIDLLLSDGAASQSVVGQASPTWNEEEKQVIESWIETLQKTPEELLVKTQALETLLAMDTPETLDVTLHYLGHVYQAHDDRPSMWRYIVPHVTLPQEAENIEDVVSYLAQTQGNGHPQFHKRQLKSLNVYLRQAYEHYRSGEFFQLLNFMRAFDQQEYQNYLSHTAEQIRIMRIDEYLTATLSFWLVCLPLNLLISLFVSYLILPALKLEPVAVGHQGNSRANPAAFANVSSAKAPAIVPIKISKLPGDEHEQKQA